MKNKPQVGRGFGRVFDPKISIFGIDRKFVFGTYIEHNKTSISHSMTNYLLKWTFSRLGPLNIFWTDTTIYSK